MTFGRQLTKERIQVFADSQLFIGLIGIGFGTLLSVIVQVAARHIRRRRVRDRLRADIGLLLRHITASLASLSVPDDAPGYLVAARLTFARFNDPLLPEDRLELLSHKGNGERARILMGAVANSNIFLTEIANRIDAMDRPARTMALADARRNLEILRAIVERLDLERIATLPETATTLAASVAADLDGVIATRHGRP